jgi:CheY-like chemotaxis protein
MPDGGTLRVETGVREIHDSEVSPHYALSPGPCVVLTLADSGEGMDAATQERIFEPFFTTKEQGRGTGLGLATVYGIVKQHGGGIWVESELGQGAVFRCCFPVIDSPPEAVPAPPVAEEIPEEEKGEAGILVVEDDEGVRNLTVTVLRRKGYSVWAASNGRDCLDMVGALDPPPHLLLTDVVLPNMTGMELYRQLSRRLPDLQVLYMSGYTREDVLSRGILPEDMAYIQKPFTPETLTRTLRQALVE